MRSDVTEPEFSPTADEDQSVADTAYTNVQATDSNGSQFHIRPESDAHARGMYEEIQLSPGNTRVYADIS